MEGVVQLYEQTLINDKLESYGILPNEQKPYSKDLIMDALSEIKEDKEKEKVNINVHLNCFK